MWARKNGGRVVGRVQGTTIELLDSRKGGGGIRKLFRLRDKGTSA